MQSQPAPAAKPAGANRFVAVTDDMGRAAWRVPHDFGFLHGAGPVELAFEELRFTPAQLPLFLSDLGGTARLVTVLSVRNGKGLITAQGQLAAGYVPVVVRAFPFALAPSSKGDHHLCVDRNAVLDAPSEGSVRFQDELGHRTPETQERIDLLRAWLANRDRARDAAGRVLQSGLVQKIHLGGIKGLWAPSQDAFGRLSSTETCPTLPNDAHALALALVFAAPNIARLRQTLDAAQPAVSTDHDDPGTQNADFLSTFAMAAGQELAGMGE